MKKGSRVFNISIILVLLFAAWIFSAPFLAKRLIVEKPLERADVILVLAGSSVFQERTQKAADLFKQGIAPKIILTDDGEKGGWSKIERRNPLFVEMAQKNLIAEGVPSEAIEIIKPNGSGTIYEAQIFSEKVSQTNWKSVLLVTSAYHTRRTLWTFEKELKDENITVGIVSVAVGQQTPLPDFWWISPRGWSSVAGEYVKSFYYWIYY